MKLDANDSFTAIFELENGAIGTIHSSRWGAGYKNSTLLRVSGTKGTIILDLDKGWDILQICWKKDLANAEWKTIRAPKTHDIYERFIASVRTGKNAQPDFAAGAKVQKYLDACFESDKTGKWVNV